jgi:hypothetical protein
MNKLEIAKQSITSIFKDDFVTRSETRDDLEEVRDLIEDYLAALDVADNEHDYQR